MLIIPEPGRFFCHSDEKHFFKWLKNISAVENVVGTPKGLVLTIKDPIDKASFYDLAGLMTRYGLDMKCLRPICTMHSDPWFRDRINYWYDSVFKDKKSRKMSQK